MSGIKTLKMISQRFPGGHASKSGVTIRMMRQTRAYKKQPVRVSSKVAMDTASSLHSLLANVRKELTPCILRDRPKRNTNK